MNVKEFYDIYYPDGKIHDSIREIFNCRNSVYEVEGFPVDILFIGDSITERFEAVPYFGRYGNVVNRGIGGEETSSLKKRLRYDALLLKPKVCVVAEGINNLGKLWRAEHDGEKVTDEMTDDVLGKFRSDMTEIVGALKANGIITIVGAVLPIGVRDIRNAAIIEENKILKELCAAENVLFADYYSAVVSDDGITMRDFTFGDKLHPHVEGYNAMAKVLYPLFDKIFGVKG